MAKMLIRIDFDNSENRSPECDTLIGIFADNSELTAHGKISKWFTKQPPFMLYLGYDGKVYPKFELREVEVS